MGDLNVQKTNAEILALFESADDIAKLSSAGLLKTDGTGNISLAVGGTDYALPSAIPTQVSDLVNDSGFINTPQFTLESVADYIADPTWGAAALCTLAANTSVTLPAIVSAYENEAVFLVKQPTGGSYTFTINAPTGAIIIDDTSTISDAATSIVITPTAEAIMEISVAVVDSTTLAVLTKEWS